MVTGASRTARSRLNWTPRTAESRKAGMSRIGAAGGGTNVSGFNRGAGISKPSRIRRNGNTLIDRDDEDEEERLSARKLVRRRRLKTLIGRRSTRKLSQ